MSDVYHLPNNAENALRKARNYLKQKQTEAALPLLEQSYHLEARMDVLGDLAYLYMMSGRTAPLKALWDEASFDGEEIANHPDVAPLYRQSLHQIYQSQDLLLHLYTLKDQTQEADLLQAIHQDISQVKEALALEQKIRQEGKEPFLSDFYRRDSLQQLSRLKLIYQMETKVILDLLLDCLISQGVNTFTKADILHYLLFKGPQDLSIKLTWFTQDLTLKLEHLSPYQADPLYQAASQAVYHYLQQHDPQLTDLLMEQFTLQALFFYPCFQQVFASQEVWAQAFLYYNLETSEIEAPADPHIQELYPQVLQDLQSMFLEGPI